MDKPDCHRKDEGGEADIRSAAQFASPDGVNWDERQIQTVITPLGAHFGKANAT
jgi:hypothetical protein